jgi:hypothetical protein
VLYFTGASLVVFAFVAFGKSNTYSDVAALRAISQSGPPSTRRDRSGSFSEMAVWKALLQQFNDNRIRPLLHKMIALPIRVATRAGEALIFMATSPVLWVKQKTMIIKTSTQEAIHKSLSNFYQSIVSSLSVLVAHILAYPIGFYESVVTHLRAQKAIVYASISSSLFGRFFAVTFEAGTLFVSSFIECGRVCGSVLITCLTSLKSFAIHVSSFNVFFNNLGEQLWDIESKINNGLEEVTLLLVSNLQRASAAAAASTSEGWQTFVRLLAELFSKTNNTH